MLEHGLVEIPNHLYLNRIYTELDSVLNQWSPVLNRCFSIPDKYALDPEPHLAWVVLVHIASVKCIRFGLLTANKKATWILGIDV